MIAVPSQMSGASADDWFAQQGAPQPTNYPGGSPTFQERGPMIRAPGAAPGGTDPRIQQFIAQWQQTHAPTEGIAPLAAAIQQQFPEVSRYMYGATPSGNELNIGGDKYKVLGGEGGPAAYWYAPGMDDSPGGRGFGGGAPGAEGYDPGYSNRLGYGGALEMDPGYQFRLKEGQQALERSAAAKGTLLTGGTMKGLARYAQDYASGEFQNRYARLFGEQKNRYDQLHGLAQLGQASAAGQAGANQQYANQAGDLQTQIGNAQAGGTVGSANAVNNAIGQGIQNALQMYYLSRLYGGGGGGTGGGYTPGQGMPLYRS